MNRQTIYRAALISSIAALLILIQVGGSIMQGQSAAYASYPHLDGSHARSGEVMGAYFQVSSLDPTPTATQPATQSEPGGSGGGGGGG